MTVTRAWEPYAPDEHAPWDLRRVVHLHRRAGFAATWREVQRDLKDGPGPSVDRVLTGAAAPEGFPTAAGVLAAAAAEENDCARLRAWWFYRMVAGPDPLGEKLTLLWHDHFATSNDKVQNASRMRAQNDGFRRHARGRFADLLGAAVRDPALLVYLDAPANRKGHPNENLARELLELFTLGVGHYTEADVKEAARALTGWTLVDGRFAEVAARHDAGPKTVLGETGAWTGSDLVRLTLSHPATAERIAVKLCRQFLGETEVPAADRRALAADLREHDLDVGWAAGRVLRSRAFFADANLSARVQCPVEFVAGAVRALELTDPAPSALALGDWAARMGQDLFRPPNVGGWPGGRAWADGRALVARANFASGLIAGGPVGRGTAYDATALPKKYGFATDARAVLTFHARLLLGRDPPAALMRRAAEVPGARAVGLLLASPEAQLG